MQLKFNPLTFLIFLSIGATDLVDANEASVLQSQLPARLRLLSSTRRPDSSRDRPLKGNNFVQLTRGAFYPPRIRSSQFTSDYNNAHTAQSNEGTNSTESSNSTGNPSQNSTDTSSTTVAAATIDLNADPDDQPSASSPVPGATEQPADSDGSTRTPNIPGDKYIITTKTGSKNLGATVPTLIHTLQSPLGSFVERTVLLHSLFIVYISVVKIFYNNITYVRNNITEQG